MNNLKLEKKQTIKKINRLNRIAKKYGTTRGVDYLLTEAKEELTRMEKIEWMQNLKRGLIK